MKSSLFVLWILTLTACGGHGTGFGDDAGGEDAANDAPFGTGDSGNGFGDSGFELDGQTGDAGGGTPLIYAHTDSELYSMDPTSQSVIDIGPFSDGSSSTPVITDLAVNAGGDVWVCSETTIYTAVVPKTSGTVKITKVADISLKTGQKFYALGFAPANVLTTNEVLVAGDNKGELYAIATNGTTTDLGNFGTDGSGGVYELSGDVVFYVQNGKPRGLATVRLYKNSQTGNDDILAEIDVAAMQTAYTSKTPATLKKQFLGTGTGFGDLFGVGAWNDNVYAFARAHTVNSQPVQAQLIQIGASGTGTSIQTFANITSGWSGAGVTTSATITILPPN